LVWHGADRRGVRHIEGYCDAWNSNVKHMSGMASNLLRGRLLDQEKYPCNTQAIVLCIEIGSQEDNNWVTRSKRGLENITVDTTGIRAETSSNINLISGLDLDATEYDGEE